MGVGAGLYMYVVVVQKVTFAISSPDEFLSYIIWTQVKWSCNSWNGSVRGWRPQGWKLTR